MTGSADNRHQRREYFRQSNYGGRFDKIEVRFRLPVRPYMGPDEDLHNWLAQNSNGDGSYRRRQGRIFRERSSTRSWTAVAKVQTPAREQPDEAPAFIVLDLRFNPTRWERAQIGSGSSEHAVDGEENFVPFDTTGPFGSTQARSTALEQSLAASLRSCLGALTGEELPSPLPDSSPIRLPFLGLSEPLEFDPCRWSLRHYEAYFDLQREDARADVQRAISRLASVAEAGVIRAYNRRDSFATEFAGLDYSASFRTQGGRTIKLYAKSPARLRYEATWQVGRAQSERADGQRVSTFQARGLTGLVDYLGAKQREFLEEARAPFLALLPEQGAEQDTEAARLETLLLELVYSRSDQAVRASAIEQLLRTGGISPTRAPDGKAEPLRRLCRRLVERGLVHEPIRRGSPFRPVPAIVSSLEALRVAEGLHGLAELMHDTASAR